MTRRAIASVGLFAMIAAIFVATTSTGMAAKEKEILLQSQMSGDQVVQGGDPDGSGVATVLVDARDGVACFDVQTTNVDTPITGYIYSGSAGTHRISPGAPLREQSGGSRERLRTGRPKSASGDRPQSRAPQPRGKQQPVPGGGDPRATGAGPVGPGLKAYPTARWRCSATSHPEPTIKGIAQSVYMSERTVKGQRTDGDASR